jgi:hypothetical protein
MPEFDASAPGGRTPPRAAPRQAARSWLIRLFTCEPIALALHRSDDDFRLVEDRSLSWLFVSKKIPGLYTKWFGEPDPNVATSFRQTGCRLNSAGEELI